MSQPLVSVVVPVFNGGKTLENSLRSVVTQTYKNLEILICDNASTDGTPGICKKFAGKDKRITYHRHAENIGLMKNYMFGILHTTGKYVFIAPDDDWWYPSFVEKLVSGLERNAGAGIAQAAIQMLNTAEEPLEVRRWDTYRPSVILPSFKRLFLLLYPSGKNYRRNYNMFLLGIFRGDLIRAVMKEYPEIPGDRPIISAIVAESEYLYHDEVLMKKHKHDKPLSERRKKADGSVDEYAKKRSELRVSGISWETLKYLFKSDVVSVKNKVLVLPVLSILIFAYLFASEVLKERLIKRLLPAGGKS